MHSDLISQHLEYDGKGFNDIILSFGNGNVNVMFLTNHDISEKPLHSIIFLNFMSLHDIYW
jgi:hypothetical protein